MPDDPTELQRFQAEVGQWGEKTFPGSTFESIVAHLVEEADELDRALRLAHPVDIEEEAADCFLLIVQLAHKLELDLMRAARAKLAINRRRTWGEPDARGVVHHVKPDPPDA